MIDTQHPDVHTPWRAWSEEQTLHVAVAYSNPVRWTTRRVLMNDFCRHMRASANVLLHTGELAYGDRPFEVTGDDPNDVQLRTSHELWHKENILNIVVQRFPPNWRYGAVIDGDFHMTRRDWALEAIHQLQHYDFVQLFSSYSDLSVAHRPVSHHGQLCAQLRQPRLEHGVPVDAARGGGFAIRILRHANQERLWASRPQFRSARPEAPGHSAVRPSTRSAACWIRASSGRPTGTWPLAWWARWIRLRN